MKNKNGKHDRSVWWSILVAAVFAVICGVLSVGYAHIAHTLIDETTVNLLIVAVMIVLLFCTTAICTTVLLIRVLQIISAKSSVDLNDVVFQKLIEAMTPSGCKKNPPNTP